MLHFINQAIEYRRVIGKESIHNLLTWIYASYKVHPDTKSHNGRCNVSWVGLNPLQITKTEIEHKKFHRG